MTASSATVENVGEVLPAQEAGGVKILTTLWPVKNTVGPSVHLITIYADLITMVDARHREAAHRLYQEQVWAILDPYSIPLGHSRSGLISGL